MKTSSESKVRELYDESAESYAAMMDAEIELPIYAETLSRLAERIKNVTGAVTDTSCGSGHMLAHYHELYDPERSLVAVDLSPTMVEIARMKLGSSATVEVGDMRDLSFVEPNSAAAVLSFYAIHHLDADGVRTALGEWHRVLSAGGQLRIAAWEGEGKIDYGKESDVVALRYSSDDVTRWAQESGFVVDRCTVKAVEEMEMDGMYLEGTKT